MTNEEYEAKIKELHQYINELKEQLEKSRQTVRALNKEKELRARDARRRWEHDSDYLPYEDDRGSKGRSYDQW